MSTANSSPPSRAAVSPARRQLVSRSLTIISSASPAEWPRLSLTVLKSSRSMNSTASCPPCAASRVAGVIDPVAEQRLVGESGQRVVERPGA
jgi:hypothetical protein